MMKKIFLLTFMALGLTLGAQAQNALGTPEDADSLYATEMLKTGTTAPDFTLNDPEGRPHSLSSMKGKYVVLDFWATWCPDCRKDVPEMKRLHAEYGNKVDFVSVSFDVKKENWTNYIKENNMPWLHLSDLKRMRESEIAKLYKVGWIPSVYIISPDGRIVLKTVMIEKVAAKLKEINETISKVN